MAILRIFWSINGDRMDNLGLIDFKIGLYWKNRSRHFEGSFGSIRAILPMCLGVVLYQTEI